MGRKFVFFLLLGILVSSSWAQSTNTTQMAAVRLASSPEADETPTIRATVREVNVIFTVTDKKGHFKKNLKSADLAVLDDGKPPVALRSFSSETDLPLRVGLVLDVSGSITDRFTFEQESAIKFFTQTLRPKTDAAFVLGFDSVPFLAQNFTDDPERLSKSVRALTPGGGSAVRDAIEVAIDDKLGSITSDKPMRRIIILISDGEDNQSRVTTPQVIDAARRSEVVIYAISTNTSNVVTRGDKLLTQLAEETGGRAFFPNKVEDVVKAFEVIQDELRSQYALSYKPADFRSDGHYRKIEILANNKTLVVRSRKGYFSPSE